jgi:hypothetical protein
VRELSVKKSLLAHDSNSLRFSSFDHELQPPVLAMRNIEKPRFSVIPPASRNEDCPFAKAENHPAETLLT